MATYEELVAAQRELRSDQDAAVEFIRAVVRELGLEEHGSSDRQGLAFHFSDDIGVVNGAARTRIALSLVASESRVVGVRRMGRQPETIAMSCYAWRHETSGWHVAGLEENGGRRMNPVAVRSPAEASGAVLEYFANRLRSMRGEPQFLQQDAT